MQKKRKPTKKLAASQIIAKLKAMEARWPDHLKLFDWSGTLFLTEIHDGGDRLLLLDNFPGIRSGGGDPDNVQDEEGDWAVF